MHYSNFAFSKDEKETLISKNDPSLKFGQRMELTPLDVKQINRLYPCDKRISSRDSKNLIPNMTERDIEERKRDAERDQMRREERERERDAVRNEDAMEDWNDHLIRQDWLEDADGYFKKK